MQNSYFSNDVYSPIGFFCLLSLSSYVWCPIVCMVHTSLYSSHSSKSSLSNRFWGLMGMIHGTYFGFAYLIHGTVSYIEWDKALISVRLRGVPNKISIEGIVRCSYKLGHSRNSIQFEVSETWWGWCYANECWDEVRILWSMALCWHTCLEHGLLSHRDIFILGTPRRTSFIKEQCLRI